MAEMQNPYCVIGSTVYQSDTGNRTMLPNLEDAISHGQCLLRQERNNKPGKKFYIVKVVGIVEVPKPVADFREPNDSDDRKEAPCD